MLHIVKAGKGLSKETKEADTVDEGQRSKEREQSLREEEMRDTDKIERLHKQLYLIKKHLFCSTIGRRVFTRCTWQSSFFPPSNPGTSPALSSAHCMDGGCCY